MLRAHRQRVAPKLGSVFHSAERALCLDVGSILLHFLEQIWRDHLTVTDGVTWVALSASIAVQPLGGAHSHVVVVLWAILSILYP